MADGTGLVALSLDIATIDGPGVAGSGTPITQIAKVSDGTFDAATVAALLRAAADRLDPRPSNVLPGHKPGCRCITTRSEATSRDAG